jgi:gas vesicle structural protein
MEDDVYDTNKQITLLDILDRVLTKGVVISGQLMISVADIDLIYLDMKILLTSVSTLKKINSCIDSIL